MMPVIQVNDIQLGYREMGSRENPTLIFAHALLWDAAVFESFLAELADHYHVIAVDVHGHRQSGYRAEMSLEAMTGDFYQLIRRLDLSQVVWIGLSIGGMLGMRLAIAH